MTLLAPPPAVILAAGRGNRLLPLTQDRPKCLLHVGGRTILEHQLQALSLAGVSSVQIVTGHGAERVHAAIGAQTSYAHNADFDRTNSFDSLGFATVDPSERGFLILNSDVLFHPELAARLLADPRENVLLADFREGLGEEEMKIVVDDAGRILNISKTIDPAEANAENLGVLKLGPAAASRMLSLSRSRDRDPRISWVPDGIDHLLTEFDFHTLAIGELPWIEIDYTHDLTRANSEVYPRIAEALRPRSSASPSR